MEERLSLQSPLCKGVHITRVRGLLCIPSWLLFRIFTYCTFTWKYILACVIFLQQKQSRIIQTLLAVPRNWNTFISSSRLTQRTLLFSLVLQNVYCPDIILPQRKDLRSSACHRQSTASTTLMIFKTLVEIFHKECSQGCRITQC